ncbi:hypothetical protein M011DRAFT_516936 [Sporormia fimetaria CBS 119925]|uniref:CFEM domain-containing protein n=1 Tax=Sporormia fimetaria CBS 119925 TaxID=1340428 RepID=A0A6A6VLB2_9PLEO|nr:hypothetical protein M011DRAFT_516936 [Sporormia fimetaria CBS 119925]
MNARLSFLIALFAFFTTVLSQTTALSLVVDDIPTCAVDCLTTAIDASPCDKTDIKCVCTDFELQTYVKGCVLKTCPPKLGLSTLNTTMTVCNAPVRDQSHKFKVVNLSMGIVGPVWVGIRMIYKLTMTAYDIGADDYFIIATIVVGIPATIINNNFTLQNGIGKDVWRLTFEQVTNFAQFLYVLSLIYYAATGLLKMSLLAFYYRIFPGTRIRKVIIATIVFNVLRTVSFLLVAVFQCQPIKYYWHKWDGEHEGKCVNTNAMSWAHAAISISLDLWMLAIPLAQLVRLRLPWKKKLGVALMFCVGTFVTIVSILRLQSLVYFANSVNPTWDQFDVINWSTIEVNVGIICACMPTIRVILVRLFPKILGSTQNNTNQYLHKYGTGGPGRESKGPMSKGGFNNNQAIITYTKTFEVSRHDREDSDEMGARARVK